MRWYIPFVLKRTDVVICQSQIWKDFYLNLEPSNPDRYVIIENWIDLKKYTTLGTSAKKGSDKNIQILFLAWVDQAKGIFELIDAMNLIKHKINRNNIQLNICGKGEAFDEIEAKIKTLELEDICKIKGWIRGDQKLKMFESSDIYVLPTYFEGFPNSLMEAMASGLPSIATDVGSIPDMIEDGYNGFIIKPKDPIALAEKLLILINDSALRSSFSHKAQQRIISNNSVEGTISKFRILFQDLTLITEEKTQVI
jgi:glycosyltransferase involved in cell wall biosynthesis